MHIPPEILAVENYAVQIRRRLHERPELSFKEEGTARIIEAELTSMGLEPRRVAKTGVIAEVSSGGWKTPNDGKTVAVRADMDALPVLEETGLDFASKNSGVMHACGHDAHVAMALGLAKVLTSSNPPPHGRVRFLFQPAEESPPGGALELIKSGALDGVDYVIGQHVYSNFSVGQAAIYYGPMMANADSFRLKVIGKGGHGSEPHRALDALVVASQIVVAAQTIVSRRIDPLKAAVITFGTFNSGYRHNIIAQYAELTGTVRTLDEETRDKIEKELTSLISGLCNTAGVRHEFVYERGYPVLVNNPIVARVVEDAAREALGESGVLHPEPVMGAEDFGYYITKTPGAFYFLGVRNEEKEIISPQHSPSYTIDEDALKFGMAILYGSTRRLLGGTTL